jgi:GAF domain-containing protein
MPDASPSRHSPTVEPQRAFLELGRLDLTGLSLTEVMTKVAELARATVPGADDVSVTLIDGDTARSVAFTGSVAVHLDERQYDRGFGPCMDAAISGGTIVIDDTGTEDRYRDFGAVAARAGIRSTLSVGMPIPQRIVGGLNFYARTPAAFDDAAVDLARAFAGYGAVALVNAALVDSTTSLATHLERAMASRATIEQAKGIIMGRTGCDADQAFAELVRRSQHANRKLALIAADLIDEVRPVPERMAVPPVT